MSNDKKEVLFDLSDDAPYEIIGVLSNCVSFPLQRGEFPVFTENTEVTLKEKQL